MARLSALVPFYNAAFAPDRFVFASTAAIEEDFASGYHSRPFYYQTAESSCIYLCSRLRPSHDLGYALAAFPQYPYDLSC